MNHEISSRPLSPWAYWGLSVLYAIPVVGFVFLIIFSCYKGNINLRNFTRSYWCRYGVGLLILLIIAVLTVLGGNFEALYDRITAIIEFLR